MPRPRTPPLAPVAVGGRRDCRCSTGPRSRHGRTLAPRPPGGRRAEARIDELVAVSHAKIAGAPSVILGCLTWDGLDRYPDEERQRAEWGMALLSLGAAVENLMLAAADAGTRPVGWRPRSSAPRMRVTCWVCPRPGARTRWSCSGGPTRHTSAASGPRSRSTSSAPGGSAVRLLRRLASYRRPKRAQRA